MKKKNIVGVLLMIWSLMVCGQDGEYIQDFSHKINVKAGLDTNIFSYKVSNSSQGTSYELKPNESVRTTASFQHRFLGLTIGFSPNFFNGNKDNALKGDTDINSIRLRLFIKRFIQEFEYYKIRGFYVENTSDFVQNWVKGEDPYLQLNGLKLKRIGGKTTFVWNRDFSYKALLVQNQKQAKSAGSFVPSLSYYYSELTNPDNRIVKTDEQNVDVNINAGYIHNFVFGKENSFYASLSLSPGVGLKFSKAFREDENNILQEKKKTHPNFSFQSMLNLGYNSDKLFSGIQFNALGVTYNKNPETKVEDSNVYLQLFVGYRFGAPKPVQRFFDKIHKKKS